MCHNRVKLLKTLSFSAVSSLTALFICCLATGNVFAEEELTNLKAEASSQYSSYYSPSKAIDNNLTTTFWRGGTGQSTWWLKLDLSKTYSLTKIDIWWHNTSGSKDYNIEGSNDSISWTTLYSRLSSVGGARNPYKVTYPLSGSYRYIRLYINQPQSFGYQPVIFEVKLYGQATADTTPPTTPQVQDDGVTTTQTTQLHATWSSSDPESGISEYQYKITQDSTQGPVIVDWTSTGAQNQATKTGLSLTINKTYYFSVKANNGVNLWSNIGYSDGITAIESGDTTKPQVSITSPSNNQTVSGIVTVSASATDNVAISR